MFHSREANKLNKSYHPKTALLFGPLKYSVPLLLRLFARILFPLIMLLFVGKSMSELIKYTVDVDEQSFLNFFSNNAKYSKLQKVKYVIPYTTCITQVLVYVYVWEILSNRG